MTKVSIKSDFLKLNGSYLGICIQPILGLLNLKYEASKLLRLEKECEDADLRWVVLAF